MENIMQGRAPSTTSTRSETYKDNFSMTVHGDRDAYLDALRSFGAGRTSTIVPVRDLRFAQMPDPLDLSDFCRWDQAWVDIVDDCIQSETKVYMEYDGKQYMLRDTALASIYDRLNIGGKALSRLSGETLARHLNEYVRVGDGEGMMLHNNGKVEAILGKNYRLVPAEDVMAETAEFFDGEGSTFQGGYICHQSTNSEWHMGTRNILIPFETGLEEREFVQSVSVRTSDCGFSSITIAPTMRDAEDMYGLKYCLPLFAEHTGDTDIDKFKTNLKLITGQFDTATTNIQRLAGIKLNHPANTLLFMFKWLKIPVKYGARIYDTRKKQWEGLRKTAFDVYSTLSDVLALSMGDDSSVRKAAEQQEKFARALRFKFEDYDVPGTFDYASEMRGQKAA